MVQVTADDKATFESWFRATTSEQRLVLRARIILALAEGKTNREVAEKLSIRPATVIFTGNKIVSGADIQSKLINADSTDGLTWAAGNIAFSASGSGTASTGRSPICARSRSRPPRVDTRRRCPHNWRPTTVEGRECRTTLVGPPSGS